MGGRGGGGRPAALSVGQLVRLCTSHSFLIIIIIIIIIIIKIYCHIFYQLYKIDSLMVENKFIADH